MVIGNCFYSQHILCFVDIIPDADFLDPIEELFDKMNPGVNFPSFDDLNSIFNKVMEDETVAEVNVMYGPFCAHLFCSSFT